MKAFLKYKVKGNSIVEVLIALAILSFCATLAVIIYLNIQKGSLPFFKIKAIELSEKYLKEAIDKKSLTEETFKEEEFSVKKTVVTNELFPDCYTVRILVFDGTKKKIHEIESTILKE